MKRSAFTICGRAVGTATGWDQGDTYAINLYDFEPAEGCGLPAGQLLVDFGSGRAEAWDDDGKVLASADLVTAIQSLPIVKKKR